MEISVLIPSHHNSPILQKCINSVVEAASKEPSADVDIIVIAHNQKYDDINCSLPIHIHHIEDPNKEISIGELRNTAIEKATKEYILFVDADDVLTPEAFTEFVKYDGLDVIQGKTLVKGTLYNALDYCFCTNICIKRNMVIGIFPHLSVFEDEIFQQTFQSNPRLVATEKCTCKYSEHMGITGIQTGGMHDGTEEDFVFKLHAYSRWALTNDYVNREKKLTAFAYLLMDWLTAFGTDLSPLPAYVQSRQNIGNIVNLNQLEENEACETVPNDDPINGGEYQHNLEHKRAPVIKKMFVSLAPAFYVDKHCNLNCSYCRQKKFDIEERTPKQILADFRKAYYFIKSRVQAMYPSILGGEPTLWDEEVQYGVMNIIQEPEYALFTNGYNTDAPIYNDPRAHVFLHIADWEKKPVIKATRDHMCFNIIMEGDKVEQLIDYINNDFPEQYKDILYISPCRSNDPKKAGTLEQLKHLQEATGLKIFSEDILSKDIREQQKRCFSIERDLQIYCDTFTYVPCCAPEFYEPINLYRINRNIEPCFKQNCQDCVTYIWHLRGEENK
jgi:glycosyltransferase involved in cell wall biosynthesis